MFNRVRVIIGAFGLVNALVCLGVGLAFYITIGMAYALYLLIPEGLIMLVGMYCFYRSRYILSGLLTLAPSLYFGHLSWIIVFQYVIHFPPAEFAWRLSLVIPITTSAILFLMGVIKWRDKHKVDSVLT